MILILSQRINELSTEEVMQWIHFFDKDCFRVNGEDILKFEYNYNEFKVTNSTNKQLLNFNFREVDTIFFRRYASFRSLLNYNNLNLDSVNRHKFYNHIYEEFNKVYDFFLNFFEDIPQLSSLATEKKLNKLIVLKEAKSVGLNVPEMIVTDNLIILKKFLKDFKKVIVKPLSECQFFIIDGVHFKMLSELIVNKNLEHIPELFFPSLFQEYIEKKYEIRVFFIDNQCFSMAIFSQDNKNTIIDFRNYDDKKPNRTVPYKLPKIIESKIKRVMSKLKLKTGSIDLIKAKNNDYYFLEINANGQFGMTSYPCNYYLEKKIATYLIKLSDEQKNRKVIS